MCVGCLLYVRGVFIVCAWGVYCMCVGCLLYVRGVFIVCAWDVYCMCVGCLFPPRLCNASSFFTLSPDFVSKEKYVF